MGSPHVNNAGWTPTRKWAVARVTFFVGWLIAWVEADTFNDTLLIALIAGLGEAVTSYLTSNRPPLGDNEKGYGAVEVLLVVFLALVILAVLFRLL